MTEPRNAPAAGARCTHHTPTYFCWAEVEVSPWGDTEMQEVKRGGEPTFKDVSVGRYYCTQCGEVFYYTGLWRDFYEKGIPCSGSEGVRR